MCHVLCFVDVYNLKSIEHSWLNLVGDKRNSVIITKVITDYKSFNRDYKPQNTEITNHKTLRVNTTMKTTTTKSMKTDVTSYDPLRSIWIWLGKSNIPNWIKLSLVNTLSHVLAFWTFNAFLTIIARKKLFLQYKLVPSKDIYKKHGLVPQPKK